MPDHGWVIAMAVGAAFIVLGVCVVVLGRREEKRYYNSLSTRTDLREFMARWPKRPQPGSLKAGGWIAVAVGLVMVIIGGAFGLVA